MIVAWNSLMISGIARTTIVFDSKKEYSLALHAAQFIADHQWENGQLRRLNDDGDASVLGQSEDYAFLINAYLDLHQTS